MAENNFSEQHKQPQDTERRIEPEPISWQHDIDVKRDFLQVKLDNYKSAQANLPKLELYGSGNDVEQGKSNWSIDNQKRRSPWDSPAGAHESSSKTDTGKQRLHGVNLCGAEFGAQNLPGKAGTDYIFPTAKELDFYKNKGMNLVRLPFLWERMQPGLLKKHSPDAMVDRKFDEGYAGLMDNFLKAADERGMKVVLDAQQFGRYNHQVIGASNISNEDFKQFWKQMAERFGHHSSIEGYDLSNEPHDEDNKTWIGAAQAGLDGVRSAGDKKTVIVEGNNWAGAHAWDKSNENLAVNDPLNNVVYSAHSYWDRDHSGTYSGGGHASYNMAVDEARKNGFLSPNEDPSNMGVNYVRPFLDWLKRHNARGYIGEFGVPTDDANWVKVQDKFLSYARQNKIDTTAWAGGPWWGSGYILGLEKGPKGEQSTEGPESLGLQSISRDGK